jgi:hypothetical protein
MKLLSPRLLLRIEGLAVLAAAVAAYRELGYPWLRFAVLFLAPDLFMFGYAFGSRWGALTYNSVHTYVAPIALALVAYFGHWDALYPLCVIWAAHLGFDRLLGYGLKYESGFKDTHLGRV